MSFPGFTTSEARALYRASLIFFSAMRTVAGFDLPSVLLQRHLIMDDRIHRFAARHGRFQVLEIACGLSPRGLSVRQRYGDRVQYYEADLPGMAMRKRALLNRFSAVGPHHHVLDINVLSPAGADSLESVMSVHLDPAMPTIVITEGLVNYFDTPTIEGVWRRIATELKRFPAGMYLTDLHSDHDRTPTMRWIRMGQRVVGTVARGSITLHYGDDSSVQRAFRGLGFSQVQVHNPDTYTPQLPYERTRAPAMIRVVEAG